MTWGIVDTLVFEISKVLELVFDVIEYRSAKKASAKIAKQKMKPQSYSRSSLYPAKPEKPFPTTPSL